MAEQTDGNGNYEMRRQSRGKDAAVAVRSWKRRLVAAGLITFVLGAAVVVVAIWYHLTFVPTLSARVRAMVVELSAKADAPLLELYVNEEDRVVKGQVLARLDDTELRAELTAAEAEKTIRQSTFSQAEVRKGLVSIEIQANIDVAKARVAIAEARIASLDAEIVAREKRLPEEIRQAEAALDRQKAELAMLEAGTREEELASARERIASAQATLALCELEVRQSRELVDEGIDSQYILEQRKTRLETQKHALRQAELDLAALEAGPRPEELQRARKAIEREEATLTLTKLGSADLEATRRLRDMRHAEFLEAKGALAQAEARHAEVAIAEQQMFAAEAELRKAEAAVAGRNAALETMEVISPIDGVITRVFGEVGELCRKGIPLILVSDVSRRRWIEAYVDEEDAMLVDIGQKAYLHVPASSHGWITATVNQVGLHTLTLDNGGSSTPSAAPSFGQPDRVWIKLAPDEPLPPETVTGTTARGTIRVR